MSLAVEVGATDIMSRWKGNCAGPERFVRLDEGAERKKWQYWILSSAELLSLAAWGQELGWPFSRSRSSGAWKPCQELVLGELLLEQCWVFKPDISMRTRRVLTPSGHRYEQETPLNMWAACEPLPR